MYFHHSLPSLSQFFQISCHAIMGTMLFSREENVSLHTQVPRLVCQVGSTYGRYMQVGRTLGKAPYERTNRFPTRTTFASQLPIKNPSYHALTSLVPTYIQVPRYLGRQVHVLLLNQDPDAYILSVASTRYLPPARFLQPAVFQAWQGLFSRRRLQIFFCLFFLSLFYLVQHDTRRSGLVGLFLNCWDLSVPRVNEPRCVSTYLPTCY